MSDYMAERARIVEQFPPGSAAHVITGFPRPIAVTVISHEVNGYSVVSDARGHFCVHTSGITERAPDSAEVAAYERGLRRGMAIAREHHERERERFGGRYLVSMWVYAEAQMEREIEEAKR